MNVNMNHNNTNNNIRSMQANRNMQVQQTQRQRADERLASGRQINRAADDAAGLAIAERIENLIRGLDQAFNNVADGRNMLDTADGALGSMGDLLGRARELTVQAANDTLPSSVRHMMQAEISQVLSEIDSIAGNTQFNTQNLLDGSVQNLGLQVGANAGQRLESAIGAMDLDGLQLSNFSDMFRDAADQNITLGGATLSSMISSIDQAASFVSNQRANIGATSNRLDHISNNLSSSSVNQAAANSQIRDADMALEMMRRTQANVLGQASLAMSAQANMAQGVALRLLG